MLTVPERIAFILLVVVTLSLTALHAFRILRAIRRGRGGPDWEHIAKTFRDRVLTQVFLVGMNLPVLLNRPRVGVWHLLVFAGFTFYFLVNVSDGLAGFTEWDTLHPKGDLAPLLNLYNLAADLLSVGVLYGMTALLIRRFIVKDPAFNFRENVMLNERVRAGAIRRDSLIVGGFILIHVGTRWLGQALALAASGKGDLFQPTASLVAMGLAFLPRAVMDFGIHATFWSALGLIFVFFPYFVRSKHIHIFFAPLNWFFFRDHPVATTEQNGAGAKHLQDLTWQQVMDAYACIMCNRCQDVCPAYAAGATLSPAALEINKRYFLNAHLASFAGGKSSPPLWEFAISKDAVWACTTCGACVEVCPVGNTPMVDIIDIRRALISDGDTIDSNLQKSLENLAKQGNSFGQSARLRAKWTQGLDFTIKDARKEEVDYLWFVGDYASFDPRGQELSRAFARLLRDAGVDFGILYDAEWNSGNDARRVGEEGLFEMLAEHNIDALSKAKFREGIITTDPHTLNALRYEYNKLGQTYKVAHYTQVIQHLLREGKIALKKSLRHRVTYHDPCYLGRYNRAFDAPRDILARLGVELIEMPRHRDTSFCCGAGGGQIWKGEGVPGEKPAESRIREALRALANAERKDVPLFVVACPKDVAMYSDAVKTSGNEGKIVVRDLIELVAEATSLEKPASATSQAKRVQVAEPARA